MRPAGGSGGSLPRASTSTVLWGGWLLVTGGVFSFMAGIIHPYYTVALAPAIGALTGIGAVELWRRRQHVAARLTLAAGIAATAAWAYLLLGRTPAWLPWLRTVVVLCGLAAAAAVLALPAMARLAATGRGRAALAAVPVTLALTAALAGRPPTASTRPRPRTPARSRRPGPRSPARSAAGQGAASPAAPGPGEAGYPAVCGRAVRAGSPAVPVVPGARPPVARVARQEEPVSRRPAVPAGLAGYLAGPRAPEPAPRAAAWAATPRWRPP